MNKSFLEIYEGLIKTFFIKGISIFFGYIFIYLIAFYFGPSGLGLYSILNVILLMLTIISVLGLDSASVRLISEKNTIINTKTVYLSILRIVIPFSILISIVFYISKPILLLFFNDVNIVIGCSYVILAVTPLSIIYITSESFRGLKEVARYSTFKFALIPLFASIILFFLEIIKFNNLFNPILSYIVSVYVVCLISIIFWIKNIYVEKKILYKYIPIKKILHISIPMLISTSMFYIIQWTDTIILSYFESVENIGIYNVAVKISMSTSIILFSINSISAPKYSELFFSQRYDEFKSTIKFSSKLIFWLSLPILLIIGIFSEFFLGIFGVEFINAKYSLFILLFGQFINILCGSVGYILLMTGKEKILRNIIVVSGIINVVLNIILIPYWGILGASISSSVSIISWNIFGLIYIYNKYGFLTINIIRSYD